MLDQSVTLRIVTEEHSLQKQQDQYANLIVTFKKLTIWEIENLPSRNTF